MSMAELKHALIDSGSSLNIMSLSTLEALKIPRRRTLNHPVKVSGFGGKASFTIGYINLDRTIGPMRAATHFHVTNART